MDNKSSEAALLNIAIRNAAIMLIVQIISVVLSLVINFLLPIYISLEAYGYWQVYVLYEAYAACFFLGYNDGIFLRYGSYDYASLPKEKLRGSNFVFIAVSFCISILLCVVVTNEPDTSKVFSMVVAFFNVAILGINGIATHVYQITNQIKKYSFFSLLLKILSLTSILSLVFLQIKDFRYFIMFDFAAKVILVSVELWNLRELFLGKRARLLESIKEYVSNVKVGFFLMLSNLTGTLILGLGKIIAERGTQIEEYARYSFANSSANLILVGITAISFVVYPTLKRLGEEKYSQYYLYMKMSITILSSAMLLLYFPLYYIVNEYITKYADMFVYLPYLFVAVYMQCRMQLVNNSFYNATRNEKKMLTINLSGVMLFLLIALPWYLYTKDVKSLAVSTMITCIYRGFLSEIIIEKEFKIKDYQTYFVDIFMLVAFIMCTQHVLWYFGFLIFAGLNVLRYFLNRNDVNKIVNIALKLILKKRNSP